MDVRQPASVYDQQPLASTGYYHHNHPHSSQPPQQHASAGPVLFHSQHQAVLPSARGGPAMMPSIVPHPQQVSPPPIKGKRKRASPQQLEVLNKVFATTSFPSTDMRNRLARELGMTPRTVQIWFQNKRQASRQRDGHHSRNTKSIASSSHRHSMSLSPTSPRKPTSAESIASSPISGFASGDGTGINNGQLIAPILSSQQQQQRQGNMSASPSWSEDSGTGMKSSYVVSSTSTNVLSQQQQQQPQGIVIVTNSPPPSSLPTVIATAAPTYPTYPTYPTDHHHSQFAPPSRAMQQLAKPYTDGTNSSSQFVHTRHDPWFSERGPARLDYLYSRNTPSVTASPRLQPPTQFASGNVSFMRSRSDNTMAGPHSANAAAVAGGEAERQQGAPTLLPSLQEHPTHRSYSQLAPPSQNYSSQGGSSGTSPRMVVEGGKSENGLSSLLMPQAVPVQRSMSLLDMLNAPPEQRRLPPLPPTLP